MSNFAFLDNDAWPDNRPDTYRKYGEVLRETVKRRLDRLHSDHLRLVNYIKRMMADKHDVTEELAEAETLACELLLVIKVLKLTTKGGDNASV
jgi:hypothetical protein